MKHLVYLSPGMFGFGRLASYDYFVHLETALSERFRRAGHDAVVHVVNVAPNASIRRRAMALAEVVARTCTAAGEGDEEGSGAAAAPIHLIGHSTGGLDARLVASPSVSLAMPAETMAWRSRLASVTTINAPHYGTPLASFFTTVSGQRVLRALSALTVVALTVGSPPLAVAGMLVAAFGRVDRAIGLDLKVIDRATDALLRQIDGVRSRDVRDYVDKIGADNGAMVQLMPEAMDLFVAGVEDRPGVTYQSVATMAPPPSPRTFLRSFPKPWNVVSNAIFTIQYGIAARYDRVYPCAAPSTTAETERALTLAFGASPDNRSNDGVVPIRSQIWGKLAWAGYADHLDVLGHFEGRAGARAATGEPPNVDWLCSGSDFDESRFASLVDAIVAGILESARARASQEPAPRVAV
jgi:triacylglycerol esterase/lipase EstA (alpha/beta hydrolase family)